MSGSFTQKQIEVDFNIVSTGQTLTITGHRVSCQIVAAGLETGVMCNLRIEGMNLSDMNNLSMVQVGIATQGMNTITVKAGDSTAPLATIFQGGVIEGFVDYVGAPNIAFVVQALSMSIPAAMPITDTAYQNGAAVADIMQAIASKGGLKFVNNGVNTHLSGGLHYSGTVADQIDAVARATRISYNVAVDTLFIWPGDIQADNSAEIEVSSSTGMIGYPGYSQYGVSVRMLFNPNISFRSTIKLSSDYSPAAWLNDNGQLFSFAPGQSIYPASDGTWVVMRVGHDLQSETPNGIWETNIVAARPDFAGSVTFVS